MEKWTKEEDEILKENYTKYSYQELVNLFFQDKTIPAVRGRVKTLNLPPKTIRWTDEEIELLKEKYENGMYIKDIQERCFPYYTVSQISSKASTLGLKHKVSCVWSKEMDDLLIEKFPYYSNKELHELYFSTQTARSIEARGRKLKLNKIGIVWTEEEDNLLKELYNNITFDELKLKFVDKTEFSILKRAKELNLKKEVSVWTDEEVDIIRKYYKTIGATGIYNMFYKTHSPVNISAKANQLGLMRRGKVKPWTEDEEETLKELYNTYSIDYLIEHYFPERTKCQIDKKKKELGLTVTNRFRNGIVFWTEERVNLLYELYPTMNTEEFYLQYFSNYISMSAMYSKIIKLGIQKTDEFKTGWTQEQINTVKELYPQLDIDVNVIAEKCNKNVSQVQRYATEVLGIYRKTELFNNEEREMIKELYPNNRSSDIIHLFPNRSVEQLDRYAVRMGVHKSKDYIRWVTLEGTKNSLNISKPQQKVNDLLDELGIKYESEFECKYYLVDHYLNDSNLMIEVQGDFWHGSPLLKEKDTKTVGIKSNITKDKRKHTYIKNKYNIEILYLWETDVNERIDLCKELILEYINNNGILENYHSFNYDMDDNGCLFLREQKYVIGY